MKISIIVINYNYAHYLTDCIESIVKQTILPHELIIVDDASTDQSIQIIKQYAKKYSWIRYLQNEKNLGIFDTNNRGTALATGDYLSLLASDDIYRPNFIEEHLKAFERFPNAGIYSSNFGIFHKNDTHHIQTVGTYYHPADTILLRGSSLIKAMRTYRFWIPSPCLIRKDLFLRLGPYQKETGEYCDFFLWALIAFEESVCYIPKTITGARQHSAQFSQNIKQKQREKSWAYIFQTLQTGQYHKYKHAFKKSHLLYQWELPIFYYLLKRPHLWSFADYSLWKKLAILWRRRKVDPLLRTLKLIPTK